MNKELENIKKVYGEKFAHLCRTLFPTILENEGLLLEILTSKFAPTHSLYQDIINENQQENFCNLINYFHKQLTQKKDSFSKTQKTAEELMAEAGYILYPECKTEDEIQAFKKYYAWEEELCTFDGGRLKTARVWFAVKKNVDQIRREDFPNPKRQDEYGTSVISIQFTRGIINHLSIKNRYNHTVNNPDATFSNNLENIVSGLTHAFAEEYGIRLIAEKYPIDFELSNYVLANDGKFYKYNIKKGDIYYCENDIVIDNCASQIMQFDGCKNMLIDCYVLDLENKTISCYAEGHEDAFIDSVGKISKIKIKKTTNKEKTITITPKKGEDIIITIDSQNNIIGYKNHNVIKIGNNFMSSNKALKEIDIPKAIKIGKKCLCDNNALKQINLPNVVSIDMDFLYRNTCLTELHLPNLKICKSGFLANNTELKTIQLDNLKKISGTCLNKNNKLEYIILPKLQSGPNSLFNGPNSLFANNIQATIYAPKCGYKKCISAKPNEVSRDL